MQGLGDAMVEMEYHTKRLAAEVAQDRLAQLAAASRPRNERLTGIRRLVVRLGELLVALECLLQAQFSSQPAETACWRVADIEHARCEWHGGYNELGERESRCVPSRTAQRNASGNAFGTHIHYDCSRK